MKRILIYGGCHAQVIRNVLRRILPLEEFDLSLLINFQLIASGVPFPYAELHRYDAVIYSPIENHGNYNTLNLRAACAAAGCASICFPWPEWHGYCPGAQKGLFKGRHQWHYPQLLPLVEKFSNFENFYDNIVENFPDDPTIHKVFEASTAMLRAAEERHRTEVRISDFIAEQFQSSRLFLISDHPSLKIYEKIIAQILSALQLPSDVTLGSEEPQGDLRTPIFPRVARLLGLTFSDTEWVDIELLPNKAWDLRTYLRLYYYSDSVILGPLENARIFSRTVPGPPLEQPVAGLPTTPDTRLFARPEKANTCEARMNYELLEILDGPPIATGPSKQFSINPVEWRSTWTS